MLADLRRQADCLLALAGRRNEFTEAGARLLGGRQVVGFGCGDGWFAARAVGEWAREDLELRYEGASSLQTLAYLSSRLPPRQSAAVAVSMSGSADRTNEAAETLVSSGIPVLALTNESGGALATLTGQKVSLHIADLAPFLTGTTKYTATVLAMHWLLEGAAARKDHALMSALSQLPAMLTRVEEFAVNCVEGLRSQLPTGIRVLSAGPNLATADYGMAKFIKLLPIPVWADEIEEFAHRQFWTCPPTDLVLYVATNPAVARCATASCAALTSMGMRTVAIDTPSAPVSGAMLRFTLPDVTDRVSPLFASIPLQFIGYFLARAFGRDPDISQDEGDPARFRAAQLLSRRGELAR